MLSRIYFSARCEGEKLPRRCQWNIAAGGEGEIQEMNYTRPYSGCSRSFACTRAGMQTALNAQTDGWLLNTFSKQELAWAAAVQREGSFLKTMASSGRANWLSRAPPARTLELLSLHLQPRWKFNLVQAELPSFMRAPSNVKLFWLMRSEHNSQEFGFWLRQNKTPEQREMRFCMWVRETWQVDNWISLWIGIFERDNYVFLN